MMSVMHMKSIFQVLTPVSCELKNVTITQSYILLYIFAYFEKELQQSVLNVRICVFRGEKQGHAIATGSVFQNYRSPKKTVQNWYELLQYSSMTHFIGWNSDLPQLYSTLSNSEQNGKFVKSTITNNFVFRFFGSSQKFQGFWVCCSSICGRSENRSICHHSETTVFIITSHSLTMQLFTIVVLAFLAVAAAFMPTGNIAR